jgi:hypothetical protein
MSQTPSIGRVVHYQRYGTPGGEHKAEPSPAIITRIVDAEAGIVDAVVFNPTGQYFSQNLQHSSEPKPGCWNWPPFVPPIGKKPDPKPVPTRGDVILTLNRYFYSTQLDVHLATDAIMELFEDFLK